MFSLWLNLIPGDSDYQDPGPQTFVFDISRSSYRFNIVLINDDEFELTEYFLAGLRLSDGAPQHVTLSPAQAKCTILDDDSEFLV